MRIHTNLTELELHMGVPRGVTVGLTRHGSRSRPHAYEITLTGYGARHTRRKNGGTHGGSREDFAATWADWGRWLASLYERDPAMICPCYADATDFHRKTSYLFDTMGIEPARLADEVRNAATDAGATKTNAIIGVARIHNLPVWIVKQAIFGE